MEEDEIVSYPTWEEFMRAAGDHALGITKAGLMPAKSLYYAQRVEDYGGKDVWWEVINNKTGATIASVTSHDAAHDLVRLFTETQMILREHMRKE